MRADGANPGPADAAGPARQEPLKRLRAADWAAS